MTIKSILVATALVISPQLYAGNIFKLTKEPLTINQCPISETGNTLDLALMNKGYFVVSHGKKDSERLFTRYGRMDLDQNGYLRSIEGNYLLAVTKKSDPNHLTKIRIPYKNLAPKATSKISIGINFPAMATEGENYTISTTIYDSLSTTHVLTIESSKIVDNTWRARVLVDKINLDEGKLVFNNAGILSKQNGLRHIQWPASYGMQELKIDFKSSTQYGSPYAIYLMQNDGYPLGTLAGVNITSEGEIYLLYSNGQYKKLRNRIAVALFNNPRFLEPVIGHLYRPTKKSGPSRIHWLNSEYAILSGGLEEEVCLKS